MAGARGATQPLSTSEVEDLPLGLELVGAGTLVAQAAYVEDLEVAVVPESPEGKPTTDQGFIGVVVRSCPALEARDGAQVEDRDAVTGLGDPGVLDGQLDSRAAVAVE